MTIEESSDNHIVTQDELVKAKKAFGYIGMTNLEKHVRKNGDFITSDIQDGVEADLERLRLKRQASKIFIQKYNPQRLSHEDYRAAYKKGELPWQNQNSARGLLSKEFAEELRKLDELKKGDRKRISKWNNSYFMNLESSIKAGFDGHQEIINGGKLNSYEVAEALKDLINEVHIRGYETEFISIQPPRVRTTTAFDNEDNLYSLKTLRRKSFFERIFGK